MQIREVDPARDVPALVALAHEVSSWAVTSPAAWLHRHRTVPERARRSAIVAEVDGRVVGKVESRLDFFTNDGKGTCRLAVTAAQRRQGIGAALFDAAYAHLAAAGATRVTADFDENDAGVSFALARGFRESRAETVSAVDPRTVDLPVGAEVQPVTDVEPRIVHRLDIVATRDVPVDGTIEDIGYDEWVTHVLDHPLFSAPGSFVAFADGEPAALSLLLADPATGRGLNVFTGTLPEYRGRGLAAAVKIATARWAAANGITRIATTNDEQNAAMLAVNRRLGYRPVARRVEYVRTVTPAGTSSAPAPPGPAR